MKLLKKISIDPKKIIKKDELVNYKGGYDGCWHCYIDYLSGYQEDGWCCGPATPEGCEILIYDANTMFSVACE